MERKFDSLTLNDESTGLFRQPSIAAPRLSFRGLFLFMFIGSLIPLLVLIGLLLFRLQRAYLLDEAQRHLMDFVQAGVAQHGSSADLAGLAVDLANDLRVLRADVYVLNSSGDAVEPAPGARSWLGVWEHQAARENRQSRMQVAGSGRSARIVYLAAVVDSTGAVLGTVEASLPVAVITSQLDTLRKEITLIITAAVAFAVLFSVFLAGIILRPVQSMLAAIERVKEGDLQARAPVSGVSEMRHLAVSYNQMLDWMSEDVRARIRRGDGKPADRDY